MTLKTMMLLAVGAASLALPAAASAQQYDEPGYGRPYGGYQQPYDGQPHGDWYRRGYGFQGYPEFRGVEMHIRREIEESVRDDMIERDDARDLIGQLRRIQYQEAREFSFHGWRLPDDDRERIRAQLDRLDRTVDQTREEP